MEADNPADLDVGVLEESGRLLSARERVHLSLALEDLFQVERVDLVVLAEVSAFLALDIIDGELLYVRDRDYLARYELYVLRRAGDLAPFERMRRKLLLQG
jgi:predicted nucleotidyltransferase